MAQWFAEKYPEMVPRATAEVDLEMIKWLEENISWDDDQDEEPSTAHQLWINGSFHQATIKDRLDVA